MRSSLKSFVSCFLGRLLAPLFGHIAMAVAALATGSTTGLHVKAESTNSLTERHPVVGQETLNHLLVTNTNAHSPAMILDLGQSYARFEWITVTPAYSNAVLAAILPYISDVAGKIDSPIPRPVSIKQVKHCSILPDRTVGAEIVLSSDWVFAFRSGYITTIQGPHSYYSLQNPDDIPLYFGENTMTRVEAIELGRQTIQKLGIPLEDVFAEQEPRVTEPIQVGTNTVPHYRIEWLDPRAGVVACVDMEINGETKKVERLRIVNKSLERPLPQLNVTPPLNTRYLQARLTNPEYAAKLIPIALSSVDEYAKKLSLPIPSPLATNHLARFSLDDNGGWPHSEIELTNGWRFIYRNNRVNGYYAPDNFFNSDNRPIRIREFIGQQRMTQEEAIELTRKTIRTLGYPPHLVRVDFEPTIRRPVLSNLSRLFITWQMETEDDLQSKVEAEVDLTKRELKSLYHDDKAYWNKPPPIDLPITLPQRESPINNSKPSSVENLKRTATRPFKHFTETNKPSK